MTPPTEGKAALEAAVNAYEQCTSMPCITSGLRAALSAYLGALSDTHRLVPANFVQDTHRKLAPPAPGLDKEPDHVEDTAPMTAEERAGLPKRCRDQAGLLRLMDQHSSPRQSHEATAKILDAAASQIEAQSLQYLGAVKGRQDFRQAFREQREAAAQARAEGYAAGMEAMTQWLEDSVRGMNEYKGQESRAIYGFVTGMVEQIRARAAEGAKAEKDDGRIWLVYSREHNAFWRPKAAGYTDRIDAAGRYTGAEARRYCSMRDRQQDGSASEVAVIAPEFAPFAAPLEPEGDPTP